MRRHERVTTKALTPQNLFPCHAIEPQSLIAGKTFHGPLELKGEPHEWTRGHFSFSKSARPPHRRARQHPIYRANRRVTVGRDELVAEIRPADVENSPCVRERHCF